MSVAVDICNSALIKLGAERINALTDDKREAKLCQEQYPKILKRVLRSHLWSFAVKRALLTPVVTTQAFGSENFFLVPLDSIRIVGTGSSSPYSKEGPHIVSNDSDIKLTYISADIPEAYFDEDFKEALACAIAADLCYAITQSNTLRKQLLEECEKWIGEARSYNSQEITVQGLQFDTWDDSRRIGDSSDADILTGPRLP